jgi:diacylglycerol kinase (ATP)
VRARLIVNPVAGRDAAPSYLELLNAKLRAQFGDMDLVLTIGAGDATRAAEEAVRFGCTHIFVAGGDGTLNEVLNGVGAVEGAFDKVAIGIVPLGTGNDFATGLGMPPGIDEAVEALVAERVVQVDLGLLNGHRFINVSAGGFIAEVSDAVNPQLKSIAGRLAYLIGGAQVLLEVEPIHARMTIETKLGTRQVEAGLLTFAVCNSRMIGGGHLIAPEALVDDGWLDVCLVRTMTRSEFVQLLPGVSRGEHLDHEGVEYFCAREITFDFDQPIKVNTDGEVREATTCAYQLLPRAVRFLAGPAPVPTLTAETVAAAPAAPLEIAPAV